MIKHTHEIKDKMLTFEEITDRLDVLKDAYKGKKCYIVGAGPSLKNYDADYVKDKLKDELVITIKQAYEMLEEVVDIQILNFANYRQYDYKDNNPIVMWEIYEQFHVNMILESNIILNIFMIYNASCR